MNAYHIEFQNKLSIIRGMLDKHSVDGLLLRHGTSFAWATCGMAYLVNTAAVEGVSSLLVTRDHCFLNTKNIAGDLYSDTGTEI